MKEGDTIIDEREGIVYTVKNFKGGFMMIKRSFPPYNAWTELDLDCFWNPDVRGEG